ncbi:MAG: hypothetical protein H6819_08660 [Phycisphaerales bacterium]|nr:hypothetical protein [Phycisphaerales bacterium]MCB9855698.1 hypothetical protein [Phycisphaerales bacterium]MCB9862593.1 hypothetical protein [Phycisphaerales bacterium]
MHYLSSEFSYLGPGFALLLTLIGVIYGVFGWRIVRMLVVLDAIAIGAVIGFGLQDPRVAALIPVSPKPAALFIVFVLPLVAFKYPRRSAVAFFGIVGFLATLLFLLDVPMDMDLRIALCVLGGGIIMALGMTLYQPTTVFVTGVHGGFLLAVAMAIIAAYPTNFIGGLVQSAQSSFEYMMPAAALAFSAILIAVQWADLQGSAASNALGDDM